MILTAARRTSDGLLVAIQSSPKLPNEAGMIAKGVIFDGGDPSEWEMVTLSQEQYDAVRAALPGRSFLNDDVITSAAPPILSVVWDTDNHRVTVTCDVGDAEYDGPIAWQCLSPDGVTFKASGNASAGVEDWIIETGQIGNYLVRVDVALFGSAEVEFREA